jgi:hypothetical protein
MIFQIRIGDIVRIGTSLLVGGLAVQHQTAASVVQFFPEMSLRVESRRKSATTIRWSEYCVRKANQAMGETPLSQSSSGGKNGMVADRFQMWKMTA